MNQRIFVTGATGLVGLHVVKHLSRCGHEIVAAVRSTSKTDALDELASGGKVRIVTADVSEPEALVRGMIGCNIVVHCAGSVDMQAGRQAISDINVNGTRNVLKSAVKAGLQQFIHISSLSVITGQEDQFNVDETAPIRYSNEPYADSKVDAERIVRTEGQDIETTILRPGFIYGPHERAWMPRLIANIKAGKAMLVDGGKRSTNVIYVENLARAVELAILNPRAYRQTYNLTDGKTPTKKELFDAICNGLDLPLVTKSVPRVVVKTACSVVALISPILSEEARKGLSRFSPGAYRLAAVNQGFSTAKAEEELGYTNLDLTPFNVGMAETLKYFKSTNTVNAAPAAAAR
jgi:2-alkyl-3-oxoalkanoate reductase